MEDFTEMVKGEATEKNQQVYISDNNGDIVAHSAMELGNEPINQSDQEWYNLSRSSLEASGAYDDKINGINCRVCYVREPTTGWTTVITRDKAVSLASTTKMAYIIG